MMAGFGIDFGALQTPDFLGGALKHYEYGRERRKERMLNSALQLYTRDPMAGANAAMEADPVTGIKLLESAQEDAARKSRQAMASRYASGDTQGARQEALGAGEFDLAKSFGEMDEQQRAQARQRAERLAVVGLTFKNTVKDPAERKAKALEMMPYWEQQGFTPEQIESFGWDDASLDGVIASAMDMKTALETYGPKEPNWKERKNADGSTEWFDINAASEEARPGSEPSQGFGGGMNELWQRLERQESGGRQNAVSPKGAFGVSQLMPATAAELAREMGVPAEALRSDENLNRKAGQLYLSKMMDRYGGNPTLALAAYNAGPGAVDKWLRTIGDPREIGEQAWAARIPYDETRNYVRTIMGGGRGPQRTQVAGPGMVRGDAPQPKEWQDAGNGLMVNNRTGERKEAPNPTQKQFDNERSLKKDFEGNNDVQRFREISTAWRKVDEITRKPNPSGQDDIALVFSFMKMLDPTSVVREGEYAQVGKAAGLSQEMVRALQRIDSGNPLTPRMRRDIRNAAATMVPSARDAFDNQAGAYRDMAKRGGVDPDLLAPEPGKWRDKIKQPQRQQTQNASPAAPKVGEVRKGYRFKGGDPASPSSWTKV